MQVQGSSDGSKTEHLDVQSNNTAKKTTHPLKRWTFKQLFSSQLHNKKDIKYVYKYIYTHKHVYNVV